MFTLFSLWLALAALRVIEVTNAKIYKIPNSPYAGNTVVELRSKVSEFDGQKISPYPNETSYEWWYFDVVSTSSANESIVVNFNETPDNSFVEGPPGPPGQLLWASIRGSFANGTLYTVNVEVSADAEATITTDGNGASGVWGDSGFEFWGTSSLSEYVINIDNKTVGVNGSIIFQSTTPAHYPCSPEGPYSPESVSPNVGWANAIPASKAQVDITIGDTHLKFAGIGYHDKNWGNKPFVDSITSWYWGHAEVGPYSLVWFDTIGIDGEEYVSGYVAHDSNIIHSSCKPGAVKVRPIGGEYPPKVTDAPPNGFTIEYNTEDLGTLSFNITSELPLVTYPGYYRYIGQIFGGKVGKQGFGGKALGEQFAFSK